MDPNQDFMPVPQPTTVAPHAGVQVGVPIAAPTPTSMPGI